MPRRAKKTGEHWHLCEVCGDRSLFWSDPCDHDAEHDFGFCTECRLVVATLNDGSPQGEANLKGFFERMALWRRMGKPQLHWRRL